jgi:phosphoribosyl 1,2-cyclic phosphodiesterase
MRMTLLGTGDASGVPVYGCECDVCGKARTSNIRRLPSSALIETQRERILIVLDCSYPPREKKPQNHNTINDVLQIYAESNFKQLVLTHIGHELDAWLANHKKLLPKGMAVGADGMMVDI